MQAIKINSISKYYSVMQKFATAYDLAVSTRAFTPVYALNINSIGSKVRPRNIYAYFITHFNHIYIKILNHKFFNSVL